MAFQNSHLWGCILGGSSGFGLAAAHELARLGLNIFIVHRDRRSAITRLRTQFDELRKYDIEVRTINADALSAHGQQLIVTHMIECLGNTGKIRTLLHSIAFGSVRSLCEDQEDTPALSDEDLALTLYSMGGSLFTWTRLLHEKNLFANDARVLSLSSEGNTVSWKGYAAISAAKSVIESLSRSIAVEFAPFGIRANVIQAGVCETPALRHIPQWPQLKAKALARNPFQRLTTPLDVARIVGLLSLDEASWINGSLIRADGGEAISGN